MKNELAHKIVLELLKEGKIPNSVLFDITEYHLDSYIDMYAKLSGADKGTKTTANRRYARKLAGLTLIKLKLDRGAKANQCKEGFVYTLTNPAWPDHTKLGMSVDIKKRLASYQTYSPFRDYKISNYEFVFNRRDMEYRTKEKFNISIEAGEWYKISDTAKIMNYVRDYSSGA